mmetsp:Transcript_46923/g.93497  ORF Transcript_46923/g.93497 Transcript_46923/m.93497 type:complete len:310 (-) Transcript_46923:30-959(-)
MARGVLLARCHMLLAGALSHDDDHVPLSLEGRVNMGKDVIELHLHLRHKTEVDEIGGEGGVRRDEARVPPHEFDDTHTLGAARRLDPPVAHHSCGSLAGRVEAECAIDEEHVVVNRLWHANHADRELLLPRLFIEEVASELSAVAADDKEHVDPLRPEGLADLDRIEAPSAGLEDRAALHMDLLDKLGSERDGHMLVWLRKAIVASRDTDDVAHAVVTPQAVGHALDDRVEARAEPAARHECSRDLARFPKNVLGGVAADSAAFQRMAPQACLRVIDENGAEHLLIRVEKVHVWPHRSHRVGEFILALA